MKLLLKFVACVLLAGALVYSSCKKEKSCEGCIDGNKPPTAVAGPDQVITLPTDSISLDGSSSSDPDGTISEWRWTKISGTASFTVNSVTTAKTIVKNLIVGVYQFELKVTDNGGLSAKDTIQVNVNSGASINHPPIANAGPDRTIILPTNSVIVDGSGSTDPDNNIIGYVWAKISGPSSFNIANANTEQTQVINLVQGVYQFEVKVTDAGGLFSKDTIQITVNAQLPELLGCDNNRPLINAQLIPVGNLSEAKRFGIATISTGNKIFFAGGIISPYQPSSRIDIFDIASNSWSTAELSVPRFNISAIANGNRVFFAGGAYSDGGDEYYVYSTVDIYDLFTNTWSVASLSEPRQLITVATVGSKVFFVGGSGESASSSKVDIYDLSADSWSTTQLSESKSGISAVTVDDNIYFAGGASWISGENLTTSSRIDIYNYSTDSWSASSLSEPKADMGSIAVANKIFWAGGITGTVTISPPVNNSTLTCSVEIKNVNTWNSSIDHLFMPGRWMPISGQNAILKDNKIVFLRIGNNLSGDKFDIYDIPTNTWSIGVLPVNIGGASFISANNTIYIAGGSVNGALSSQVWKLEF